MFFGLAIVVGLAIVGLAVGAIAVALAFGLHSRYKTSEKRGNTDAIWIGVGVTIIVLVCVLALVAALAAAMFLFGVSIF